MLRITKFHILLLISCLFLVPLTPMAALAQASDAHVVINTYRLNVRTGPGAGHGIITDLPGGTTLPVTMLSTDRKWYEVSGGFGTGWLRGSYTVERGDWSSVPWQGAPSNLGSGTAIPADAPHLVVNTSYLNARTGPGIGHNVLIVLPGGTKLLVTAIDRDGKWYQVETSAGTGWVNSSYTVIRGNFTEIPRTGAPTVVLPTAPGQPDIPSGTPHLLVNTGYLNVRSGPGISHDVILTVPGGAKLAAVGIAPDLVWYEVATSAGNGWVNSNYTIGRGDFSNVKRYLDALRGDTPRALVNTSYLNIRTGPGAGHSVVVVIPGGTTLAVLGKSADGKWFLVEGDFGQGWLRNRYVAFRGNYGLVQVAG